MEPLLLQAEAYSRTGFEVVKLKALEKTADMTSTVLSRVLLALVLSFFVLSFTIALALWLGDLLGKNYYGFLIVAGAYAVAAIIVTALHPQIKTRITNAIITKALQ